jgi:two-component system, LytTR family, response regulator AlgR
VAAFDADVRDYVLKPVRRERLERALGRLGAARSKEVPRIRVKIGRREQLVPLDEIDCFVAEDGYVMARSARVRDRACLGFVDQTGHMVMFRDGLEGVSVSRRKVAVSDRINSRLQALTDHHVQFDLRDIEETDRLAATVAVVVERFETTIKQNRHLRD